MQRMAGDTPLVLYVDWGISGARADRAEYIRLKSDIEAGRIQRVYAYSLSRLGRNARELLEFSDLCQANGVTFTTTKDAIDTSTAGGRAVLGILAVMAELERELAAERANDRIARQRNRGDALGQPGYGFRRESDGDKRVRFVPDETVDIGPITDAYNEVGTVAGAVRLLNERGIPSPRGEKWHQPSLARVLDAHNVRPFAPSGRRVTERVPSIFAGLLRCGCGATLTPTTTRGQYYCGRAKSTPNHGPMSVKEAYVREWAERETEEMAPSGPPLTPDDWAALLAEDDDPAGRALVEAERTEARQRFARGALSLAEMTDVERELDERLVAAAGEGVTVDWGRHSSVCGLDSGHQDS